MHLTLGELLVILLGGFAAMYLFSAMRVRELALQAVVRASGRDDFQLLDQSVHIQRISMSKDETGRWRIWRQYRFDYSYDGVQRSEGHVIMLGRQLRAVVVAEPAPTLH
ncbi:MAG: DUF3301 domain-containing protein [Halioglobus sp.]